METLPKEKHHLVLNNLRLVHYILHKQFYMYHSDSMYEDYYSEGVLGLILAAIRFDENKGFKFSTFASKYIYHSIQRFKREKESVVKIPRNQIDLVFKVMKLRALEYSLKEIIEITGYTEYDISTALSAYNVNSLEETYSEDEKISLKDTIPDNDNSLEEIFQEQNILESVNNVSKYWEQSKTPHGKDIWEEYIWSTYFGERITQNYLATKYGLSQAQISRVLRKSKELFVQELGR